MKVLVLGVVRVSGTSHKTGTPKPYDMTRVTYGVPVNPVHSENRTVIGSGYEVQDLDLEPQALPQFEEIKLPGVYDLDVQPNPSNLRRNICQGIRA
jgi:hypothetical protein